MQNVMKAFIAIELIDKITAPLNGVKKSMKSFNDVIPVLNKLGTKMIAGGGAAIYMGKGFVDAAGQVESYRATLKNMFGGDIDQAENRLKELSNIAATTPFELPQVIEAGNKLQSLGRYSQETLIELGDLASFAGKPMEQAMNAFTKMASGQKGIAVDMFRDLLITTDDWQKATGKGISNSGELLATTEEMIRALPSILKEKNVLGAMDAQSKTFKGVMSNLSDALFQFHATYGEHLLEPLKTIVKGVASVINSVRIWGQEHPKLASFIARFTGVLAVLSVTVGIAIVLYANWHRMSRNLQASKLLLSKSIKLLTANIWQNITATKVWQVVSAGYKTGGMIGGLKALSGMFGKLTLSVLKSSVALLASPFTWIVIGIVAVTAHIIYLVRHWERMKDATLSIFKPMIKEFNRLKENLRTMFEPFKKMLEPIGKTLKKVFNFDIGIDSWKDFLGWIAFGAGFLMGFFEFMISKNIENFIGIINAHLEAFLSFVDQVTSGFTDLWDGIQLIINGDILEGLKKIGTGILKIVTAPIVASANLTIGLINNVLRMIDNVKIKVPSWVPKIGGNTYKFDMPQIPLIKVPSFASGVENFSGGLAYVHQDELISLPKGANVHTKKETKDLLSGNNHRGNKTSISKHYHIGKIEINPETISELKSIADLFKIIDREVTA